jgi:hypothetical protein
MKERIIKVEDHEYRLVMWLQRKTKKGGWGTIIGKEYGCDDFQTLKEIYEELAGEKVIEPEGEKCDSKNT